MRRLLAELVTVASELRSSKAFWVALSALGYVVQSWASGAMTGQQAILCSAVILFGIFVRHELPAEAAAVVSPTSLRGAADWVVAQIKAGHPEAGPTLDVLEKGLLEVMKDRFPAGKVPPIQ